MGFQLPYQDNEGDYEPDSFEEKTTKNLRAVQRNLAQQSTRIVHGLVSSAGAIVTGAGYAVSQVGTGVYTITFTVGFADAPTLSLTPSAGNVVICTGTATATGVSVEITDPAAAPTDSSFYFVCML